MYTLHYTLVDPTLQDLGVIVRRYQSGCWRHTVGHRVCSIVEKPNVEVSMAIRCAFGLDPPLTVAGHQVDFEVPFA